MLSRRESQGLPFNTLSALWNQAGAAYGILGSARCDQQDRVELRPEHGPSSAGAIGWMQFMPSTWERWEPTPPATV